MNQKLERNAQGLTSYLLWGEVGIILAGVNLWLLERVSPQAHRILLTPKRWLSPLIVEMRGLDSEAAAHEPLGLWLQLLVLAVAMVMVGVLSMRLLRAAPWSKRSRLAVLPPLVASVSPWAVLLLVGNWDALLNQGFVKRALVGLSILAVSGITAWGAFLMETKARVWGIACLASTALLWQALVMRHTDFYARPVAYASAIVAAMILPIWLGWRKSPEPASSDAPFEGD